MKVYVSHADADWKVAKRIADGLRESGFDVWDPDAALTLGDNWPLAAGRELAAADIVVVLVSAHSMRSKRVQFDIALALGSSSVGGRLLPVVLAPSIPSPWFLRRLTTVRLFGDKKSGIKRLATLLRNSRSPNLISFPRKRRHHNAAADRFRAATRTLRVTINRAKAPGSQ
jgi:hypothetical protein